MIYATSLGARVGRRGTVAPMVAVCLLGVLGVTAIAIDGSMLVTSRREAQATADAAALAAAIDLFDNYSTNSGADPSGTAATSAQGTVQDNLPSGSTLTVKKNLAPPYTSLTGYTAVINIPPKSGAYAGLAGYAEVIVILPQQQYFSSLFGAGNLNAMARAVAKGSKAPPGIGVLVLAPSGSNTLQLSATGSANVTAGTIVVDSSNSAALHLSAGGSVTATQIRLTGSSYSTSSTGTVNGLLSPNTNSTILANQAATADPYANWAKSNTPTTSGMTTYNGPHLNSVPSGPYPVNITDGSNVYGVASSATSVTLYPGYYKGGLTINQNTAGVTFTLQTGVYYFDANVTFNGYGTIQSGTGGTLLYISSGSLTNSSQNVNVNLSPLTTGTYSDPPIVLWSDQANSSGINFSAGGSLNIATGIIYAPNTSGKTQFTAKAGTTAQLGSQVVVGQLWLTGSGNFNVDVGSSAAPGRQLYLVE